MVMPPAGPRGGTGCGGRNSGSIIVGCRATSSSCTSAAADTYARDRYHACGRHVAKRTKIMAAIGDQNGSVGDICVEAAAGECASLRCPQLFLLLFTFGRIRLCCLFSCLLRIVLIGGGGGSVDC